MYESGSKEMVLVRNLGDVNLVVELNDERYYALNYFKHGRRVACQQLREELLERLDEEGEFVVSVPPKYPRF